ncbi:MAG: protein jag [Clostridia bacterium]|nr:protein jag [Clostridia bacterium]
MNKFVEIKASTVDLAVANALEQLGVARDRVNVEVLSKGGLFSKAHVRVMVVETALTKVEDFVNGILEKMGLVSKATVTDDNGTLNIEISGEDSGTAIGYRGEALDAIQYLVLTYLNQEKSDFKKVVVDSENYREKRRETLTALALRLAEKAHRTARKIELEPMNPFERRVIHSALADSEIADTVSEGEESNRHVVIIPKGVELKNDRRRNRRDGKGDNDKRNRDHKGSKSDKSRREKPAQKDYDEIPDGKVYSLLSDDDDFVKPTPVKTGPPKFKSFGGQKR